MNDEELTIEPLKTDPAKPNEVRDKINEIIEVLNSLVPTVEISLGRFDGLADKVQEIKRSLESTELPQTAEPEDRPEPTVLVQSVPRPASGGNFSTNWWRPINDGEKIWMPPIGSVVPSAEVPPLLLEHFKNTGKVLSREELDRAESDAIRER